MTILKGETAVHFCNRFEIQVAAVINHDFLKLPKVVVLRNIYHLMVNKSLIINQLEQPSDDLEKRRSTSMTTGIK